MSDFWVPGPPGGQFGEVTCVEGETFCVSGSSGQIRRGGNQGLFVRDTRVLNHLLLRVDRGEPHPLAGRVVEPRAARFVGFLPPRRDLEPDPRVIVRRRRVVSSSLWEEVELRNYHVEPVRVVVELEASTDFAHIFDVKQERHGPEFAPRAADAGLYFADGDERHEAYVRPSPPAMEIDEETGTLRWPVELPPQGRWLVGVSVGFVEHGVPVWPTRTWSEAPKSESRPRPPWRLPELSCSDQRLTVLLARSEADLASLLVRDPEHPDDVFCAAGSPWYLTLFGRDSLWTAFMSLPFGTGLAAATLRVLARRQGVRDDPETEEAPGKILHEVRHGALRGRSPLPPMYYGTMDATPLFVTLLHEAWRWGMPAQEVERLLPAAEAALGWMDDGGDPDGDGFLEYAKPSGRGLTNQGWKDSEDAVVFADGRLAEAPIALCEVQGYAYDAAVRGAELLERFGRPEAARWRAWAARLRERFREAFWVDDPDGAYPALGLDGSKQRIDALASNIGHLPATGLLDPDECALVAARLASADLDSGWGLRTLSAASPRFNPFSYHCGSVWPHDTAVAVFNLASAGHGAEATRLLTGLLDAAPHFAFRLPELFGGDERPSDGFPIPYPTACRPQAWSAGAALLGLRALLGLDPHVPDGRLRLRPIWPAPFAELRVVDLPLGPGSLSMTVLRDHGVHVADAPPGLDVEVVGAPRLASLPGQSARPPA